MLHLAKLGWKILIDSENLWIEVFFAKYLTNLNFLEGKTSIKATKVAKASIIWKYILYQRYSLKKGLRWTLGNGE